MPYRDVLGRQQLPQLWGGWGGLMGTQRLVGLFRSLYLGTSFVLVMT